MNEKNQTEATADPATTAEGGDQAGADQAAQKQAEPQPTASGVVETHEQAAEINATRTAEDGYVKVGDPI